MAAIEHHCRDCDKEWFDNLTGGVCQCGSTNVAHYFDEDDDEPPWDDDDEDEFDDDEEFET